jgi:hypothetical protein
MNVSEKARKIVEDLLKDGYTVNQINDAIDCDCGLEKELAYNIFKLTR